MRLIGFSVSIFLMLAGCSLLLQPVEVTPPNKRLDTSIVRLHDSDTGDFFCSGTVISDTQILTAAHCVIRETMFGAYLLKTVEIRTQDGQSMGLTVKVRAANPRQDVAILEGDFKLFDKRSIEIQPNALEDSYLKSSKIIACGYPAGGKLVCTTVKHVKHQLFGFSADGFLYPGMSGGPVIDVETGKVIGVNTAVLENRIYLSPLPELFKQLGL